MVMQQLANKVKPTQLRSSLVQEWLEMVVVLFNRRQNKVRFIGPTGAGEYYDAQPDRGDICRDRYNSA